MVLFRVLMVSVFGVVLLSGCTVHRPVIPEVGHYYLNPDSDMAGIGKVVMLELKNETSYPDLSEEITAVLASSLTKKHVFSMKVLDRGGAEWQELEIDKIEVFDRETRNRLRDELGCNGIIFGEVADYRPFPASTIGLRMKLLDLRNGHVVWGIDQVWDATDKGFEERAKRYFSVVMKGDYSPMDWRVINASPRAFNKFVAYEVCQTLPSVGYYAAPPVRGVYLSNPTGGGGHIRTLPMQAKDIVVDTMTNR
jgi:hypothetical protein